MSDAGRASAMSGPGPHMLPPGTDLVGRGDELARLYHVKTGNLTDCATCHH